MNVSQQIDQFIEQNGGNARDALNVALARLDAARSILQQISDADASNSPSAITHADDTIQMMRDLADSFLDYYNSVIL